jgi:pyruvate kinase
MVNIENIYKRALADYILLAGDDLGVALPIESSWARSG